MSQRSAAETAWHGADGWYDVTVRYFNLLHGKSHFSLSVAGNEVDAWDADDTLPSDKLDGHPSTRQLFRGIAIHRGDVIRVRGRPDGNEKAPLDYIEVSSSGPSPQITAQPERR